MYCFYCTVGTETGAGPLTLVKVESTYITVNWTQPKYSPVKIEVVLQQYLSCERQPYSRKRIYVPPRSEGMNFTMLKPGSLCRVTYVVIYNPSESDRGVEYIFATLSSSKAYTYVL